MTKRYPIPPIRVPSAIPIRGVESRQQKVRAPVRARAPIRLCNQSRLSESGAPIATSLKELIDRVRKDINRCPLTIVVHGWGSESADAFLSLIWISLEEEDAVWLVQVRDEVTSVSPPKEGAVLLSVRRDEESPGHNTDYRIHNNLVGDIVFFSASEKAEIDFAASFSKRVRVLVVDGEGEHREPILDAAREARLIMYLWSGSTMLKECSGFEEASLSSEIADATPELDLEEICELLKNTAMDLENEYSRRLEFRSQIEKLLDMYPGRPTWNSDLIELADKCDWPRWTSESLPSLYVRTREFLGGGAIALVWHFISECLPANPQDRVARKMWGGEFYEIHMTADTAQNADSIAAIFKRHLGNFPYPSQRARAGAINDAMQDAQLFLQEKYPETAAKIDRLRQKIMKEILTGR